MSRTRKKIKYTLQSLNVVPGTQVDCYFRAAEEVISECRFSSFESNNGLSACNYNCEESFQKNLSSNNQSNNEEQISFQQNPSYFSRIINTNSCNLAGNNLFSIDDSAMLGAQSSMMETVTGSIMDDLE